MVSETYHCEGPAILAIDGHLIGLEDGNFQTPYYKGQNDLGNVKDQFEERDLLRVELPSLPAHFCQSVMPGRVVLICFGKVWRFVIFPLTTPRCSVALEGLLRWTLDVSRSS